MVQNQCKLFGQIQPKPPFKAINNRLLTCLCRQHLVVLASLRTQLLFLMPTNPSQPMPGDLTCPGTLDQFISLTPKHTTQPSPMTSPSTQPDSKRARPAQPSPWTKAISSLGPAPMAIASPLIGANQVVIKQENGFVQPQPALAPSPSLQPLDPKKQKIRQPTESAVALAKATVPPPSGSGTTQQTAMHQRPSPPPPTAATTLTKPTAYSTQSTTSSLLNPKQGRTAPTTGNSNVPTQIPATPISPNHNKLPRLSPKSVLKAAMKPPE